MKHSLLILSLALAGCAAPQPKSPEYADCEYKAKVATPGSNNVFSDVFRERELIDMCMRNKGFTRR